MMWPGVKLRFVVVVSVPATFADAEPVENPATMTRAPGVAVKLVEVTAVEAVGVDVARTAGVLRATRQPPP